MPACSVRGDNATDTRRDKLTQVVHHAGREGAGIVTVGEIEEWDKSVALEKDKIDVVTTAGISDKIRRLIPSEKALH